MIVLVMVIPCQDLSNFLKNSVFSEIYWTFFLRVLFYSFLLSRWENFNGPFIFMDHFFPSTPTVFYWSVKYDCIWYSTGDDGNYLQSRISYICQKLKVWKFSSIWSHFDISLWEFAISIEVLFAFNKCIKFNVADNCHHHLLNTNWSHI